MKLFLLAVLAVVALAHATGVAEPAPESAPEPEAELEHEWMWFPDGEGIPRLIDLKEEPENLENDPVRNVNGITFNLYTRNNRWSPQVITLNNANTINWSIWNSGRHTRFVIHGWQNNLHSDACVRVRDAYLNAGDFNVIVVDWGNIASSGYNTAAGQVRNVAQRVADFINFMRNSGGLNVGNTHVVGHSLGGHVAGISALRASGTVAAVVALDPAMPLFTATGSGTGIHSGDAAHVQVIHTNGGLLGLSAAVGNSDFYPNGGSSQPGCGTDIAGTCAHSRAYLYFAESLTNPTGFRAANGIFMGGPWLSVHARGSYHFATRANSPFAMG